MKNVWYLFVCIMLIMLSACRDPCKDIVCANGDCVEGICNCVDGFEGDLCDTEVRAKYLGTWTGPSTCDSEFIDINMITVIATASETGIYDITYEVQLEGLPGDLPAQTGTLFGNAFEIGPEETEVFGFPVEIEVDGIFKSDTELSMDISITGEVMGFPISISCDAELSKVE